MNIKNLIAIIALLILTASVTQAEDNKHGMSQQSSITKAILSIKQAFLLNVKLSDPNTLQLNWYIEPDAVLYKNKIKIIDASTLTRLITNEDLPQGIVHDNIAGKNIYVFEKNLSITIHWPQKSQQNGILISYQGCNNNGFCYSPVYKQLTMQGQKLNLTDFTGDKTIFTNKHAATKKSNPDKILSYLTTHSLPITLIIFFLFGILLTFTPCMLPLLPITVNIIVGTTSQNTTYRSVLLVSIYVFSMAICYTIAGVAAAYVGASLQIFFQKPWFIILICSLLTIFAVMQLEIISPAIWHRLSARLHFTNKIKTSGSLLSVIIMGAASAVALSPCATPTLIGILTYISQTGNPWLGGAALFSMSIGMGTPLIGIALIGKQILPKAGVWLHTIKHLTGLILLSLAIWLLGRILTEKTVALLWIGLMIVAAVYLGAFNLIKPNSLWCKLQKFTGACLILCTIIFVIDIIKTNYFCTTKHTKSSAHNKIPLDNNQLAIKSLPEVNNAIENNTDNQINNKAADNNHTLITKTSVNEQKNKVSKQDLGNSTMQNKEPIIKISQLDNNTTLDNEQLINTNQNDFQVISNMKNLELILAQAKQTGKPVLLYFHAGWCMYCKALDSVFNELKDQEYIKQFTLLQVDLSDNTDDKESIMEHYKIFGLPAVLFFTVAGIEQKEFRLSEALSIDDFKQHIDMVLE